MNLTSTPAPTPGPVPAGAEGVTDTTQDAYLAIRNGLKLGASLLLTWGVALGIRILLPRYLGPERFGAMNFADGFSAVWFVLVNLGVDTYIRKEVPVRPEHASDFFGGVLLVRALGAALIFVAMALVLLWTGRPREVWGVVFLFGAAQLLMTHNNSLAALLHAQGRVDGLSVANVASKVVWGLAILVGLWLGGGLHGIAFSLVLSEGLKALALSRLAGRHLRLRLAANFAQTRAALRASFPFYLSAVATSGYAKLDVSLLTFLTNNDREVGWYGAASTLAGLALLVTPLIGWVLMPLFSRAVARSEQELTAVLQRAIELVLTFAIPISLMLSLGADVWVRLMFGASYDPAALPLRILAPMFVFTYVATVTSTALIMLDRGWVVTLVSLGGLAVNPVLNLLLIRPCLASFGPAGGGAGCAISMIITEVLVTGVLLWLVRGRSIGPETGRMLGKTLVVCAIVVGVDRLIVGMGPARILVEGLLYGVLVIAFRAVRLREMLSFGRAALRRSPPEAPAGS